jgi:VanZ family protein
LIRLLLLTIGLIVYGSLYPWQFRPRPVATNPLTAFAESWSRVLPQRLVIRDACINIAIYLPVGILGHFVFARGGRVLLKFIGPIALGFMVSFSIETAQLFTRHRVTSARDLIWNTAGTAAGVAVAVAARRFINRASVRGRFHAEVDRGATALFLCWFAYLFFPFFPVLSLAVFREKLRLFTSIDILAPIAFVSGTIAWFMVGRLLASAKLRSPGIWLAAAAGFSIPAQLFISTRQPSLFDVAAAVLGVLLFTVRKRRPSVRAEACAVVFLLLLRGLAPFSPPITPNAFIWVPFGGVLKADWQDGYLILLEKFFYYGLAIWAVRRAGISLSRATWIIAIMVSGIEASQTYLRGRTPEITDVLLALLVGLTGSVFKRSYTKPYFHRAADKL